MTSKHLPWHGLAAQLFLKFLLITRHEVPFINTSDVTKRSSNRTEYGKCIDVTNRRSGVVGFCAFNMLAVFEHFSEAKALSIIQAF